MRAPKFWNSENSLTSTLLIPASKIYASKTAKRLEQKPYKSKTPVICVGNLVAGGAGKTPTVLALSKIYEKKNIHFLTRGYGGTEILPSKVVEDDTERYGDEAVLLSHTSSCWVGADRAETAKKAQKEGADLLIMDDGFQNPSLFKDFSIVVVDGSFGFGNERVIPAGPLREPIEVGLKRADAILVIGEETANLPDFEKEYGIPKFTAEIKIDFEDYVMKEDILAFCGIARPEKFFNSLKKAGLNVVEEISFPDHHNYSENDLKIVFDIATKTGSIAVTTPKDFVKIPQKLKMLVKSITSELVIENEDDLKKLINKKIKRTAKK